VLAAGAQPVVRRSGGRLFVRHAWKAGFSRVRTNPIGWKRRQAGGCRVEGSPEPNNRRQQGGGWQTRTRVFHVSCGAL